MTDEKSKKKLNWNLIIILIVEVVAFVVGILFGMQIQHSTTSTPYVLSFPNSTTYCKQIIRDTKDTNTSFKLVDCSASYSKVPFNISMNLTT